MIGSRGTRLNDMHMLRRAEQFRHICTAPFHSTLYDPLESHHHNGRQHLYTIVCILGCTSNSFGYDVIALGQSALPHDHACWRYTYTDRSQAL
jgi:hypothetical protein